MPFLSSKAILTLTVTLVTITQSALATSSISLTEFVTPGAIECEEVIVGGTVRFGRSAVSVLDVSESLRGGAVGIAATRGPGVGRWHAAPELLRWKMTQIALKHDQDVSLARREHDGDIDDGDVDGDSDHDNGGVGLRTEVRCTTPTPKSSSSSSSNSDTQSGNTKGLSNKPGKELSEELKHVPDQIPGIANPGPNKRPIAAKVKIVSATKERAANVRHAVNVLKRAGAWNRLFESLDVGVKDIGIVSKGVHRYLVIFRFDESFGEEF